VTKRLVVYASTTRGFEEIGNAPFNAANRDEAPPAQITSQVDAGIKYQLTPRLQLVAGLFEIKKPYFNLDRTNIYRNVGSTSNRGAEFSLAGDVTDRLKVVAGVIIIDPKVSNTENPAGPVTEIAVGPIPLLARANFQYRMPGVPGLTLEAKGEFISSRWARYDSVRLPSVTLFDAGFRYSTQVSGKPATLRLQLANLTNAYSLTVQSSGWIQTMDPRRFDLSLAFDL
jgi:iron complex outermembrane receptor protein